MLRPALILLVLATAAAAQTADEIAFAKRVLEALQPSSFASNREYCGTIGTTEEGDLIASRPLRGAAASCTPRDPRNVDWIVASFHTHAAFDPGYDSEVPSTDDVLSDMEEGIDGYVSTPGGRLWFIDGQTGVMRQICGLGCLPQDPAFEPGVWGPVPERLTLEDLERREAE